MAGLEIIFFNDETASIDALRGGQIKDLESTINATDVDVVVIATPIDLGKLLKIDKPSVRVSYELEEIGQPKLADVLDGFLAEHGLAAKA